LGGPTKPPRNNPRRPHITLPTRATGRCCPLGDGVRHDQGAPFGDSTSTITSHWGQRAESLSPFDRSHFAAQHHVSYGVVLKRLRGRVPWGRRCRPGWLNAHHRARGVQLHVGPVLPAPAGRSGGRTTVLSRSETHDIGCGWRPFLVTLRAKSRPLANKATAGSRGFLQRPSGPPVLIVPRVAGSAQWSCGSRCGDPRSPSWLRPVADTSRWGPRRAAFRWSRFPSSTMTVSGVQRVTVEKRFLWGKRCFISENPRFADNGALIQLRDRPKTRPGSTGEQRGSPSRGLKRRQPHSRTRQSRCSA